MASRIVRCRAGASRGPPVSRVRRPLSRASSASGDSILVRAAASSIASGSPSSRRQISATAAALASVRAKSAAPPAPAPRRGPWRARAASSIRRSAPRPAGPAARPALRARRGHGAGRGWWPGFAAPGQRGEQRASGGGHGRAGDARSCRGAAAAVFGAARRRAVRSGCSPVSGTSNATGDRGQHQGGISERRQIDEDHAIGERVRHVVRDGQRQAGLADAAGTGQGQQRDRLVEQQGARRGDLTLPPDEAGARDGQRCTQRCQRLSHDVSTVTERRKAKAVVNASARIGIQPPRGPSKHPYRTGERHAMGNILQQLPVGREGRPRLLRRPRHQRRHSLDAGQGRHSLRLHRQSRPARRARLRGDPAPRPGLRRRAGAADRLPAAARRPKVSPPCSAAPSTSRPPACPTSTPPRSAARSPARCWWRR